MKNKGLYLKRRKKQIPQNRRVVGVVVLNDSRPSNKSVNIVANQILQKIEPKNHAVIERAKRDVLEKLP